MARCEVCGQQVSDTGIIDHLETAHPGALRLVADYAISGPDEMVTIERRHLERAPGETELRWLTRMARNLGYLTTADIPTQGLGCVDCGVPFAPGFRFVQRLVQMLDGGPVVEIICLPCAKRDDIA